MKCYVGWALDIIFCLKIVHLQSKRECAVLESQANLGNLWDGRVHKCF